MKNGAVINKFIILIVLFLAINGCNEREKSRSLTKEDFSSLINGIIKPGEIDNIFDSFEGSRTGYSVYAKITVKKNIADITDLLKKADNLLPGIEYEKFKEIKKNNLWKLDPLKSIIFIQKGTNPWTSSFTHYWFIPKEETNVLYMIGWGI
jgi:hypothetical protein